MDARYYGIRTRLPASQDAVIVILPSFLSTHDRCAVCLAASARQARRHTAQPQRRGDGRCSDNGWEAGNMMYVDARDTYLPPFPPGITNSLSVCRPVLCCRRLIGHPATAPRSNPKSVISQAPRHPQTGKRSRSRESQPCVAAYCPPPVCRRLARSEMVVRCRDGL